MLIENKNQPTASRYGLTRRAACLGIGTAALSAATGTARASDWPTRAVTVVVPYSPGGNTDMVRGDDHGDGREGITVLGDGDGAPQRLGAAAPVAHPIDPQSHADRG